MAADKFRRRVNHDINAMVDRPQDIRRNRIVQNKRDTVFMRQLGYPFEVGDVQLRITNRFGVNSFRLRSNRFLQRG